MKTKKNEIKSAYVLSQSPLVLSVTYKSGGIDTYTPLQMSHGLTSEAEKYVMQLCGIEE
jgi:hypothetical protein